MPLFSHLDKITNGHITSLPMDGEITHLLTDSRKITVLKGSVFFAIDGIRHDGHKYLEEVYKKGVRNFVVEKPVSLPDANILKVNSAIVAMQAIASYHRAGFDIPIIGITGSNGKTIIKEWLDKLLSPHRKIVKSPRSYNSQLGVPLSVWNIGDHHELGIFEAGISTTGEMERLEKVIKPTIGIFSNLGSAHDEGFSSHEQKAQEKAKLFIDSERVIYRKDNSVLDNLFLGKGFSWGFHKESDIVINSFQNGQLVLKYIDKTLSFSTPFNDTISMENVMHCITLMLYLDFANEDIQRGVRQLTGLAMRLELKKAINGSYVIDDSYNNDLVGLRSALDFLQNTGTESKALILSDILQSGQDKALLYKQVAEMLESTKLNQVIGVGPDISEFAHLFSCQTQTYNSTKELLVNLTGIDFSNQTILVKGARDFRFEQVVKLLEEKNHGTRLEINLDALTDNLNFYRSNLKPDTKLMVMVKAFGYGAGSQEVANLLAYHNVDYLGVAYTDEGVFLRQKDIRLPIMVMNPSSESFEKLVSHRLEPEIYSLELLRSLITGIQDEIGIHIKLETGMNRLGFTTDELPELISLLKSNPNIKVKSVFSHLAGSDSPDHTKFSVQQVKLFRTNAHEIKDQLGIQPLMHILNSSGILRFPEYQFDMVRLGIGLYGIDTNELHQEALTPIAKLKTVVSQLKHISKGETVGYGRKGVADRDMTIATIAIGYADGFSRAFSNGIGKVWVNGAHVPVIGNVCMDMTMIDVTGLSVVEGDEVEIFGNHLPIQSVAENINTIPYEILATIGARVKRTYYSG
ncbi:MAG: bifunctional UDP-N-acetylmuramoyl-tripeptide:D-alanyl-D-alanine ligase/alanine racemase [Bacteroidota bacterium]